MLVNKRFLAFAAIDSTVYIAINTCFFYMEVEYFTLYICD